MRGLTSRTQGHEGNTSRDDRLGHIAHEIRVKEEESRVTGEELAESRPSEVGAAADHDANCMGCDWLLGGFRLVVKYTSSKAKASTHSLSTDAVEEANLYECNNRRDTPDIDDAERLDRILFE